MSSIHARSDLAEKSFVFAEERSFRDRAAIDRSIGHWVAGRLGLGGEAADRYAAAAVAAGVRSAGGRGGFDHLALSLGAAKIHIEELRTRYAIALAVASLPPLVFAEALRLPA